MPRARPLEIKEHSYSVDAERAKKGPPLMNATSISFGLLIALFTILLLRRLRKLKPQIAGYGTQRMCPSCGLITSRLKACCLECGKPLAAVVYSIVKK